MDEAPISWPVEPLRRLGRKSVADFMRGCWQRRPLLIRAALPGLRSPVDSRGLFALASRDDVESRLITAFGGRWRLRHGPLPAGSLPPPDRRGWTLLVQGADLHSDAAAALLARFRFVPDARLDDLMISYASDGGGVGPHVDSYDVFLLQAQGRRRWRIGRQSDLDLMPDRPLKLLADFRPTQEWVLEPGDMLYLPPGVAHEGVAVGTDCITCSIGFRTPAYQELLDPWLDTLAERIRLRGRYRDPAEASTTHPARLPAALIEAVHRKLSAIRPTRRDAAAMLLAVLSEPKPQVSFQAPARRISQAAFAAAARRHGLRLDARTRLLYDGACFAINGDSFTAAGEAVRWLARLADRRCADQAACTRPEAPMHLLHTWYQDGWLHDNLRIRPASQETA